MGNRFIPGNYWRTIVLSIGILAGGALALVLTVFAG